jgi:hypothetical protein
MGGGWNFRVDDFSMIEESMGMKDRTNGGRLATVTKGGYSNSNEGYYCYMKCSSYTR